KRNNAVITEAVTQLRRNFGQRPAAERIAIGILRSKLLIAEAPYRSAATSVKPAARGDAITVCPHNDAQRNAPRQNDVISTERQVAAGIDPKPGITEKTVLKGSFRCRPARNAKPTGRVQHVIGAIVLQNSWQRADDEGPPPSVLVTFFRKQAPVALVREQQLAA